MDQVERLRYTDLRCGDLLVGPYPCSTPWIGLLVDVIPWSEACVRRLGPGCQYYFLVDGEIRQYSFTSDVPIAYSYKVFRQEGS